jgi:hypothetical protein
LRTLGPYSRARLDSDAVIQSLVESLFATEVLLGRLHWHVPQQELNLLQFAHGSITEASAGTPQIVRGEFQEASSRAYCFTTCQTTSSVNSTPRTTPLHEIRRKSLPSDMPAAINQSSILFHPTGNWNRSNVAILSDEVYDGPVVLAALEMVERETDQFSSPQSATQQDC